MTLQLGDVVPNFTQDSSEGEINFFEWAGDSWVVLFPIPQTILRFALRNWVR